MARNGKAWQGTTRRGDEWQCVEINGKEWQGKAEGGDEVDRSLPDRALAKLGRMEVTIGGYQGEMDKEEKTKK